jgi:hypothetical protein
MPTLSSLTGPTADLVEVGAENLNTAAAVVCTNESELPRLDGSMDQLLLRLCGRELTDYMEKLTRLLLGTVCVPSHAPTTRSGISRGAFQTLSLVVMCFLA